MNLHAESFAPPTVNHQPGPAYQTSARLWQGIPGIERTAAGRLYATWYTGGEREDHNNHVLLVRSDDDGVSWTSPLLVIDPPGQVRAFDPVLWIDPRGRLWLFWAQCFSRRAPKWDTWNGVGGVWFICCDAPDLDQPTWSSPRRIANGIMMNKPVVLTNGEWHLPVSAWSNREPRLPEMDKDARCNSLVSTDEGVTFARRGTGAEVPCAAIDEPMIVELRDRTLWMLIRTQYGVGQSFSTDGAKTWSRGRPTAIAGPDSRFHIRRLPSGRLLLVNHYRFTGRSHLTASLSDDDGQTWHAHLLLDERSDVSYPDATVAADGRIFIIYDRERHDAREILMACVTEDDILAGSLRSENASIKRIVNRAKPTK